MTDNSDLYSMSRKDLEQLRKDVEEALIARKDADRREALEHARRAAAEHGYTLEELAPLAKPAKKTKGIRPVKFRDPQDPTNTWSGRGRRPRWMQQRLDDGVPESTMEV